MFMEINVNLYKVGYFVGRYGIRADRYITMVKLGASAFRAIDNIATERK